MKKQEKTALTLNMQLAGGLSHAVGVAGHALVHAAVVGEGLADGEGAAVALEQQLDVPRLLDGLLILEPDHLEKEV